MRRLATVILSALLLTGILGVALASAEGMKIGIVDLTIVIDESKAGKKANVQLNDLINSRQANLDALEVKIVAIEDELEAGAASLTSEQQTAKQAELDKLVSEYLAKMNEYENEIQVLAQTLQNQILNEIGAVLQWYGDSKDYSLILDSSVALYYRRVVDLTWDIIREYDALKDAGRL